MLIPLVYNPLPKVHRRQPAQRISVHQEVVYSSLRVQRNEPIVAEIAQKRAWAEVEERRGDVGWDEEEAREYAQKYLGRNLLWSFLHRAVQQSDANLKAKPYDDLKAKLCADLNALFIKHVHTHVAVLKFGYEFLAGNLMEGNACCKSMLKAFREVVHDYNTPPENGLSGDMIRKLNRQILFLKECCAQSLSMQNSFSFLKASIDKIPSDMSHLVAKANLCSAIDHFIIEIVLAGKIIVGQAVTKINNGDVVLTYGSSSVIEKIFSHAFTLGKEFHVVVVDSRPNLEGQVLLRSLVKLGISCKYAHIESISYIMRDVTTVFLKGASLFANGDMYARVGTECVSIVANSLKVPVLCCCETYMYSRISSDPLVIAKAQGGIDVNCLENWTKKENLKLTNLLYDVTSTDYFPMIINEKGIWSTVPEQE